MTKTVHVIPEDGQWAIAWDNTKVPHLFSTQREAIKTARELVRKKNAGQIAVHGRNGRITRSDTFGMPPIQDPPGKRSVKIEKAVGKITRERLEGGRLQTRG